MNWPRNTLAPKLAATNQQPKPGEASARRASGDIAPKSSDAMAYGLAPEVTTSALVQQWLGGTGSAPPNPLLQFLATPEIRLLAEPLLPKPDVPVWVEVDLRGRRVPVEVTFSGAAVELMREAGWSFDFASAELVAADGGRTKISLQAEYERQMGREGPAWVAMDPKTGLYTVPRQVSLDVDERGDLRWELSAGEFIDHRFARSDATTAARYVRMPASAYERIPEASLKYKEVELPGNVRLFALDDRSAALAQRAYQEVCGELAAKWPARQAKLEAEAAAIDLVTAQLRAGPQALGAGDTGAAFAVTRQRARQLADLVDAEPGLSDADLLAGLRARKAAVQFALKPTEIYVVPAGKHFSAMPQFSELTEEERLQYFDDAAVSADNPDQRLIFLPLDDLETPTQMHSRHELYHLDELHFMDEATLRRVDAIHRDTIAKGGAFGRRYGVKRSEFLTTCAEEFEGGWGPDGPKWLKDNVREMYDILSDITGRRPE